ncbi:MAG: right-handed parallel beta-helix repeat-containing protein, partial [Acidimicrobiia bacterium]
GAVGTDYLDEGFAEEPGVWTEGWHDATIGSRNRLAKINDGADGSAVRVTMPARSHFGSAAHWQFGDHGFSDPQALYFRYYLRFPADYVNHGRGKLPGFGGLYSGSARNNIKPSDSQPGWSGRMLFSPTYTSRDADYTQIGFYVYHRGQIADQGDLLLWDTAPAELRHGSWYCVEGHVSMNTPGVADGTMTGWVDEKLAFAQHDFMFRGAGDAALGVKSFWFDTYYGGVDPAPATLSVDIDELRLSSERIGCGGRAAGSFDDTGGSIHRTNIAKLAHAGITRGCNPPANDLFCPTRPVTRGQMAAFLVRALGLPPSGTDFFSDDADSIFEANINALAASGITRGCGDGTTYCPDRPVTREQMAAFLDRALALPGTPTDHFVDDDDSIFETSINSFAEAGITAGCNPPTNDRFCGTDVVTREQMASFMSRALALPAPPPTPDGPAPVVIPPGFDAVVPAGASIQATVNSLPPGAALYLEAGLHPRQSVSPKPGQTFVGAPGALLDGQGQYVHAFASKGPPAVDNVTISGVEITGYDPAHNEGAIHTDGSGWTVSDCEIHHTDNVGIVLTDGGVVERCNLHHNKQTAIRIDGATGAVVADNEIANNNYLDAHMHIGSGGAEFTNTTNLVVRGNHVHDNHGHGLWAVADNVDVLYEGNVVENNYRAGIFHAQSYAAIIRNNTLRNNGTVPGSVTSPRKDAGILIAGPDVEVYGNTVVDNFNAISFFNEAPRIGSLGPTNVRNGNVHDNLIIDSGLSGATGGGDAAVLTTTSFASNTYQYTDTTGQWWYWDGHLTWADWQAAGNDTTGSLTPR